MKKKTTFYIDEDHAKLLTHWIYKYYELTGKKITRTDVINMLLEALLNTNSIEQDIREMQ